jgi:hypothetical protein
MNYKIMALIALTLPALTLTTTTNQVVKQLEELQAKQEMDLKLTVFLKQEAMAKCDDPDSVECKAVQEVMAGCKTGSLLIAAAKAFLGYGSAEVQGFLETSKEQAEEMAKQKFEERARQKANRK